MIAAHSRRRKVISAENIRARSAQVNSNARCRVAAVAITNARPTTAQLPLLRGVSVAARMGSPYRRRLPLRRTF